MTRPHGAHTTPTAIGGASPAWWRGQMSRDIPREPMAVVQPVALLRDAISPREGPRIGDSVLTAAPRPSSEMVRAGLAGRRRIYSGRPSGDTLPMRRTPSRGALDSPVACGSVRRSGSACVRSRTTEQRARVRVKNDRAAGGVGRSARTRLPLSICRSTDYGVGLVVT